MTTNLQISSGHNKTRSMATLTILLLTLGVAGCLSPKEGDGENEQNRPEPRPCVEGEGCSWSLQSEESARAGQRAVDEMLEALSGSHTLPYEEREALTRAAIAKVQALPGIEQVERAGSGILITTDAGYTFGVDIAEELPPGALEKLASPPADIEGILSRTLATQALVSENASPLGKEKKRARLVAAWNWQFEEDVEELAEILREVRDYDHPQGVEVFDFDNPWPQDEVDMARRLDAFRGWSGYDLIYVSAHGLEQGTDFRINTGIVIGYKTDKASEPVGYDCLRLRRVASMEFGIGCTGHRGGDVVLPDSGQEVFGVYTLTLGTYWLTNSGSSLKGSRTLALFTACEILARERFDAFGAFFLGEESVLFAPDDVVTAREGTEAALLTELVTHGFTTKEAYARMDQAMLTSLRTPGVYRLLPRQAALRIVEVITMIDPARDDRLEDFDTLPVEFDEEGRPRLLSLTLEYVGVNESARDEEIYGERYTSEPETRAGLWLTDITELDGPDGEPIRSLLIGPKDPIMSPHLVLLEGGFQLPVKLAFDRDLDTDEPVHIRATTRLPEGGESHHTLTITPKPIESAWTLLGNGQTSEREEGYYVDALHQRQLDRLSVYLREDQEAFIQQDGDVEVSLTIPGFDGAPGTYSGQGGGTGWVLVDIEYNLQDIRCYSAKSTVELTTYEDEDNFTGTFATGDDTICYFQDEPVMEAAPFSGRFLLKKPN